MSSSYGIVDRRSRSFIIVNPGYGDRVDTLIDMKPDENRDLVKIKPYYEGIKTMLFDDGPRYRIYKLIFTSNKGSLVSSRCLTYSGSGEVVNYVMKESDYEASVWFARFVLWCERIRKEYPKVIEDVVVISSLVKEKKEEEICVICYQADHMVATLPCKHGFHEECIKKWLKEKPRCPICRSGAFLFN